MEGIWGLGVHEVFQSVSNWPVLYCIVLYLQPVLNPKSYNGARVLEASNFPIVLCRIHVLLLWSQGREFGECQEFESVISLSPAVSRLTTVWESCMNRCTTEY